jgi:hypothetical protein
MTTLASVTPRYLLFLLLCVTGTVSATPEQGSPSPAGTAEQNMDLGQVILLLRQQQAEMVDQRQLLQAQADQIAGLKNELDSLRGPTAATAQADQAETATLTIPASTVVGPRKTGSRTPDPAI